MNILWIAYGVLGKANELFYGKKSQGGGWIEESANRILPYLADSVLTIVSLGNQDREKKDPDTGILYVEYSEVHKRRGHFSKSDTKKWKNLILRYTPDIIQVFGVEFSNGLNILEAANKIPVLFYIQGIMASFKPYRFGGMNISELIKRGGLTSIFKFYKYYSDFKQYISQIPYEQRMIEECDGVIIDGNWSKLYLQKYNREVPIYIQTLPVGLCFLKRRWEYNLCEKNTIFTVAGRTPYKGLHNLIKAIGIVQKKIPDVKLYIPGNMYYKSIISKPPYLEYIEELISNLKLQNNIVFCGQLSSDQMAQQMLKCNVFVMPSCIENHSSSLREAMYVGTPCITSTVGCIQEIARYGENLLLYRYPEIDQLAGHIIDVLQNEDLAKKLGENAQIDINKKYPQDKIGIQIINNYNTALKK